MNKTKTIFISNLIAIFLYFAFCGIMSYNDKGGYSVLLFLFLPIILVIFNILAGIIIFLAGNKELSKAFFLVGIVGLLIGGSFCGLLAIVR
jgi:hypothetical protein